MNSLYLVVTATISVESKLLDVDKEKIKNVQKIFNKIPVCTGAF